MTVLTTGCGVFQPGDERHPIDRDTYLERARDYAPVGESQTQFLHFADSVCAIASAHGSSLDGVLHAIDKQQAGMATGGELDALHAFVVAAVEYRCPDYL